MGRQKQAIPRGDASDKEKLAWLVREVNRQGVLLNEIYDTLDTILATAQDDADLLEHADSAA